MRMNVMRYAAALFFLSALSSPYPAFSDSHARPNVLILHSYHKGLSWVDDQTAGMTQMFRDLGVDVMFHVEYMDWKFSPTQDRVFSSPASARTPSTAATWRRPNAPCAIPNPRR